MCVLEIFVLKNFFERLFWEIFVLIGSLVELYVGLHSYLCFFSLEKLFWKAGLTPPQYLAICRASQAFFLTQSQHLLDTWWIDQESFCLLDSFSTPNGLIELLLLILMCCSSIPSQHLSCRRAFSRHLLDRSLDTSWYLHLSRFTCWDLLDALYKASVRFRNHFSSISLSILLCFSPKTLSSHSKLVPQGFFKLFQVSLYLVSF